MATVIVSEKPYNANEKFYNILINHTITDKNYEHVLNAWEAFKMNTLKDYYGLYLKVHVLLLFCVFEAYWKEFINSLELHPAHCLSTLGLNLDRMLMFPDVNIKLVKDIEKCQFLICRSDAKASNKFLKSYGANKPISYII